MSRPKSKSMSDFLVTFFVDNRAFSQLLSDVLKNKHQALFNETLGLPSDFIIPFSQEENRGSVIYTIKANLCGDYDITLNGQPCSSCVIHLKRLNEQIHYLGQYLSTKATYKEFLQANNKKIYRSEHQDEIAKYEEAAQFLKRSSPDGTIPTMKDLRAEKEKLLSIRTARYESYAYFKDYYHELQTACQNVDMILETEHTQQHSRTQPKRRHEPSL